MNLKDVNDDSLNGSGMELTLQPPTPGMNGLNWSIWFRNLAPGRVRVAIEAFDEANFDGLRLWEMHFDCHCSHGGCGKCRGVGFEFTCTYSNEPGIEQIRQLAQRLTQALGCPIRDLALAST